MIPCSVRSRFFVTYVELGDNMGISEITEIYNNSSDTYFMYVWDDTREGRYAVYPKVTDWTYPDEGKWFKIPPNSRVVADDCGIPDGGKSAGRDRSRVIFKAAPPNQATSEGDPARGLRINRVGEGDNDALQFRDNETGLELQTPGGKRVQLPSDVNQKLSLHISNTGAQFQENDMVRAPDVLAILQQVGQVMLELAPLLLEAMV